MKLLHITRGGTSTDITDLAVRFVWSGDASEVARKLEVSLVYSAHDRFLPKVFIDLGEMLMLMDEQGKELWRGYVFTKNRTLSGTEISYTAYDGLIYLKKSNISKNFKQITAEAIAKLVCAEFQYPVGKLAATNVKQSFVHVGKTAYEAIMAAYTAASHRTGKTYMPRMREGKLEVIEKGATVAKRILTSATDLVEANFDETIDNMVNKVVIVGDKGEPVGKAEHQGWREKYGLLQQVYSIEKNKDAKQAANAMLHGVDPTASVQLIGGPDAYDLIAGNAVRIEEEVTGLTGLFYIDNDTHTFENGQHTVSLNLNYRNTMDEFEAQETGAI